MKNYYYSVGERLFSVNTEKDFPEIDNNIARANIDYSYRIKEDGVLKVKDRNGNITEHEVKENDVVFVMYSNTDDWYNRTIIILRDDRFIEYYKGLDKYQEEERIKRESPMECVQAYKAQCCDDCCNTEICCEKSSL